MPTLKQAKELTKNIISFGNGILNLMYFQLFYAKVTPGIISRIEKLNIIDPHWQSDIPTSYEEYLDLIIVLKLNGIEIKNIQENLSKLK